MTSRRQLSLQIPAGAQDEGRRGLRGHPHHTHIIVKGLESRFSSTSASQAGFSLDALPSLLLEADGLFHYVSAPLTSSGSNDSVSLSWGLLKARPWAPWGGWRPELVWDDCLIFTPSQHTPKPLIPLWACGQACKQLGLGFQEALKGHRFAADGRAQEGTRPLLPAPGPDGPGSKQCKG